MDLFLPALAGESDVPFETCVFGTLYGRLAKEVTEDLFGKFVPGRFVHLTQLRVWGKGRLLVGR